MKQTKTEELWNAASHGAGILLGVVGLILLLIFDSEKTKYSTFSVLVYGISIILLFSASTIYHAVTHMSWKETCRKIDHISIYFLIAGTYTPVSLISLEKSMGWYLFGIVWGITAIGILLKLFYTGKFEILSLLLYLIMGWLIVLDLEALLNNQSFLGIFFLALGGAFYTIGIIFYVFRSIPYNHVIWHFFVLGGAIAHFLFIFLDVI